MMQKHSWTEAVLASAITLNEVTMICRMKKETDEFVSIRFYLTSR